MSLVNRKKLHQGWTSAGISGRNKAGKNEQVSAEVVLIFISSLMIITIYSIIMIIIMIIILRRRKRIVV